MAEGEKFDIKKFVKGIGSPLTHVKTFSFVSVIGIWLLVGVGGYAIFRHFFPEKKQATSSTPINIARGATVGDIRIINKNNEQNLKQGIYGRLSSVRVGLGVFKEVTPNIDISLGANKKYNNDEYDFEVETRYKF